MRWHLLAAAFVCLSPACGGGGDSGFAGAYQVTQIGEDIDGCGGLSQIPIPPEDEFFELVDVSGYGSDIVEQHECSAPGTCEQDFPTLYFEDGGDWVEEYASADGFSMPCYVTVTRATLGRIDDNNIEIHTRTQSGDIASFPDGCPKDSDDSLDWDAVEQHYDELPCVYEKLVQATLMP
jgi:hypothetical protein